MVRNLTIILSGFLLLFACSRSSTTSKSKFVVNLSSLIAGLSFPGGAHIRVKELNGTNFTSYDLQTTNVLELKRGSREIYFVGFEGASDWSSPYKCGLATPVVLDEDVETVNLTVSSANCTLLPNYMAMIIEKNPAAAGTWDVGNWDTAYWAP